MMRIRSMALVVLCAPLSAARSADASAPPPSFDGRWMVSLVCPDTQDRKGLVKGYDWTFPVAIVAGKVDGRHGTPGEAGSVRYTGNVAADGTLELTASGNTGAADYSVGQVARGTNYGYTMTGRLAADHGQATRREVRPCTANFARLPS